MGKSSCDTANCDSKDNGLGSREADHVIGSPKENRGISARKVGEDKSAAEKGCLEGDTVHRVRAEASR